MPALQHPGVWISRLTIWHAFVRGGAIGGWNSLSLLYGPTEKRRCLLKNNARDVADGNPNGVERPAFANCRRRFLGTVLTTPGESVCRHVGDQQKRTASVSIHAMMRHVGSSLRPLAYGGCHSSY